MYTIQYDAHKQQNTKLLDTEKWTESFETSDTVPIVSNIIVRCVQCLNITSNAGDYSPLECDSQ
jgi:hypothetical protein